MRSIPQTPAVSKPVQLPRVISGMRFTWGFVLALVVGLVMYYVLFWTSGGFKLRAVGYNMTASRFNGIPVKRYILTSFIISGAIAGLGGGAELLGTQFRLINGFGSGLRLRWRGHGADRSAAPHRNGDRGACSSRRCVWAPPPCRPLPASPPVCRISSRRW